MVWQHSSTTNGSTTGENLDPIRWDLSNVYPSLESPEFKAGMQSLAHTCDELEQLAQAWQIGRGGPINLDDAEIATRLTRWLMLAQQSVKLYETLEVYIYSFVSTDSSNQAAQRETSRLELINTRRQKLATLFSGYLGGLAPRLDAIIRLSRLLDEHAFFLKEAAQQSKYLMEESLEALASDLNVNGAVAFGRLQGTITSQLTATVTVQGTPQEMPLAAIVNLRSHPHEPTRANAFQTELKAWEQVKDYVAACLNSVKGTAWLMAQRRGRQHPIEAVLDYNRMERATLDALVGCLHDSLPLFRRYFAAKAKAIGKPRLAWWDLFAPVGGNPRTFLWAEAKTFITEHFAKFDAEMAGMAQRAFQERWIDAGPRRGKRGGAFCVAVMATDESRVLMNFDSSFDQVSTLAHELGHAYHNHCQGKLSPLLRGAPMTLAETASIFCETLVCEAAIEQAPPAEQLGLLEVQLLGASQVCVDILSRYKFETEVFARRPEGELTADDFCHLMQAAQTQTYADAVDSATLHPFMWLWKPHYYAFDANFYNFPYAFGLLFALALFAVYRETGPAFVPKYKQLLRDTGSARAEDLAARFGFDIRRQDFWNRSLSIISEQIDRYESLVAAQR